MKGYILNCGSIWGQGEAIGFGDDSFCVKTIDRNIANEIIVKNHYSGKFYNCSYIHLGVFHNGDLLGVIQYGYAMNPASGRSVVPETENNQYLELNRMWMSDRLPRNSESMAISYSIKYIRRNYPCVKWIQSFADQRCGKFGIVYQAANFSYYGEHVSVFWELDGQYYHNIAMTAKERAVTGTSGEYLQQNADRAIRHDLRQFRYIYFIDRRCKAKCNLKEQKPPKHYKE